MAKAWDTAVIKTDTNNADKGRAGVVQAVTDDKLTLRLDETADGKPAKVVEVAASDCDIKHVL